MAESRLPITVRIICCAMRHMSPEVNKEVADVCWRFRHSGVVAFDLAGPEYGFPPDKHIAAFQTMREKSVGLTIHAGEAFGAKSVELALACNANRIGHGTRVVEDKRVLQQVIDRRIPLEMCVSSNVQTKAINKLEEHPIKRLFDKGVICVPCTDNPTVSGVTLSGEYFMLQNTFGFNVEEIVRMMDFGFRSAFVDETLKRRLRIEAITKTIGILKKNQIDISGLLAKSAHYGPVGLSLDPFKPHVREAPASLEFIRALRKADTDTRLIGSVPLPILWKYYEQQPAEKRVRAFEGFDDFKAFMTSLAADPGHKVAKRVAVSLLQTEEAIREGVRGIVEEAAADNVTYLELGVCPARHASLIPEQAVLDAVNAELLKAPFAAHIVILVNIAKDSPIAVQRMAELAVSNADRNIVGFGTVTAEISAEKMRFFQPTFDFLRAHFISVSMFAGEKDPRTIPIAIVRGNARRIAGGFQVAESCALLNEVCSHGTSIQVAPTPRMAAAVDTCFAKNPVRSFYDLGVKTAIVSIHQAFAGKSRSEQLFQMAQTNGFDALDIIHILHYSFGAMFEHYAELKEKQNGFWEHAISTAKSFGIEYVVSQPYYVSSV